MLDKLIFYNNFGNGDIHESREFVKDMMKIIPAEEYFYSHLKSPDLISDIPNLQFFPPTVVMNSMSPFIKEPGTLYINTWIGRDSRYVLPGIGCTIEENYKMFNEILGAFGHRLTLPVISYIPKIEYAYYNIDNVKRFVNSHISGKVLICNGPVRSAQAHNFDFTPVIINLVTLYRDIEFIITEKIDFSADNLHTTDEVVRSKSVCDLNEVSYLSTFCDVIVGRSSGPFLFCQTYQNWMDLSKVFLSFSYKITGANIVHKLPVLAKKMWSPDTETDAVTARIEEAIQWAF